MSITVEQLRYPKKERFQNPAFTNMADYSSLVQKFKDDYEGTWADLAKDKIEWIKPFTQTLDQSNPPFYKWFLNGKLNVTDQCVTRHLKTKADKIAIKFEGDRGDTQNVTYQQLENKVNKTANLLKNEYKIKKGDRVILYMPMIVESVVAMLACAKIGAIQSIVFGGFSAEALRDRIEDAQAKLVITADGAFRKGKAYMLKPVVDEALKEGCESIENVCVIKRNNQPITWVDKRDSDYNELLKSQPTECKPEIMDSEDPLFLLYTSGSTGKPKGVQHASAGYILWAQLTMEWVFDIKDSDTYWCAADIGWITGHTYIVYGPLAAGATTFLFEGVPTGDNSGRCFELIEKYHINQFYTAPTVIRMLQKLDADAPKRYDLSSLRILGTVGEPIDPAAWKWYFEKVGNSNCSIVDTYWQTETGGHVISPLPAATPFKPGCATLPLPGIQAEILNKDGTKTPTNQTGLLCITKPWPAMLRTIWGDDARFQKAYFGDCEKDGKPVYFTGDGATKDENGYITITGRVDDVINVSGHRFGTAEIESSVKKHDSVAAVSVVSIPHEIKGEGIAVFVVGKTTDLDQNVIEAQINAILRKDIGPVMRSDKLYVVPDLPKTRSGKIMRRLLRSIAKGEEITQDTSTLENPAIVSQIEAIVKNQ